MRIVLIVAITFVLNMVAYSQESKPIEPEQRTTTGNPITLKQVLELPPRDAPRLTLQQALKIAERFIKKERLDRGTCYLYEARWIASESNIEGAWHFWWVRSNGSSADVKIIVSLDGKPKRLSSR